MEVSTEAVWALFALALAGMAAFVVMLWLPLKILGLSLRDALHEIELPEAVFFGLYAVASAKVVGSLFARFVG